MCSILGLDGLRMILGTVSEIRLSINKRGESNKRHILVESHVIQQ